MKKNLRFLLSFVLAVALVLTSFTMVGFAAGEDEVDVTVGSVFEYNKLDASSETRKAWSEKNSMWIYQYYHHNEQIWRTMVYNAPYARWQTPNDIFNYAYVRNYGDNFHPAKQAETAKTFICPSSGTINFVTKVARVAEFTEESVGTPTSLRILLNDEVVYPTDGTPYQEMRSTTEQEIRLTLDVYKNDRVRVVIGSINGDNGSDALLMSNTVTYTAVSDEEQPDPSVITDDATKTNSSSVPSTSDDPIDTRPVNTDNNSSKEEGGMNPALIVGIVVGVIVVAAIVIFIIKKKRSAEEYYEDDDEESSEE